MIVVSDTSPMNYLAIIGYVNLLEQLFGSVVIPTAVANELAATNTPEKTRALVITPPPWLSIQAPHNEVIATIKDASSKLGAGELEAIALAKELKADLLLADERRATRVAREQYQLRVTGVLGVLEVAAVRRLIELPAVIQRLELTTYRMPKEIVAKLLERDAQRRSSS